MIALVVCAILVFVLVEDLRRFRVRNGAVVALSLCFPADCLLHGRLGLLVPHLLLAGAGLMLLAGSFFLGLVGGGDAKLLTAAMLWVGPEGSVVFAFALLIAVLSYAAGAWAGWLPSKRVKGRLVLPLGPSIALAWIATIGFVAWLQL